MERSSLRAAFPQGMLRGLLLNRQGKYAARVCQFDISVLFAGLIEDLPITQ
jgi:hypothetical protein